MSATATEIPESLKAQERDKSAIERVMNENDNFIESLASSINQLNTRLSPVSSREDESESLVEGSSRVGNSPLIDNLYYQQERILAANRRIDSIIRGLEI